MNKKTLTLIALLTLITATSIFAAEPVGFFNKGTRPVYFSTSTELGFFGFFSHKIQFSEGNTYFDYVEDGGQDVLFPFKRFSADITVRSKHILTFLIQPIDVRTQVSLSEGITMDNVSFPAGPLDLRYGFDFYRFSYMYDFWSGPFRELAFGLSFQLRDAVIDFSSPGGQNVDPVFVGNRDVGPVPILKFRFREQLTHSLWIGSEVDGFYASFKVLNGSVEAEVTGLILDASLRLGISPVDYLDTFINLRYLGGGAEGTSSKTTSPGDGYTKNYLHAFSVSLGVQMR
jgi:hypothetical protein